MLTTWTPLFGGRWECWVPGSQEVRYLYGENLKSVRDELVRSFMGELKERKRMRYVKDNSPMFAPKEDDLTELLEEILADSEIKPGDRVRLEDVAEEDGNNLRGKLNYRISSRGYALKVRRRGEQLWIEKLDPDAEPAPPKADEPDEADEPDPFEAPGYE